MQEDEENEIKQSWKKKHMTEKLGVTEKGPAFGQKKNTYNSERYFCKTNEILDTWQATTWPVCQF